MSSLETNRVYLDGLSIHSVTYIKNSFTITTGELSGTPNVLKAANGAWIITVLCSRKKSKPVADAFNGLCGGPNHISDATSYFAHKPAELNFYFGLRVGFKPDNVDYFVNLYLGQGSNVTDNNWWIGSDSLANDGAGERFIPLITPSGAVENAFDVTAEGGNTFKFGRWFVSVPDVAQEAGPAR